MNEEIKEEITEPIQKYFIKIGTVVIDDTEYTDRCMSQNFGSNTECVESETLPWEGTEHNPYDYKYVDGAFILEPIEIPVPVTMPTAEERLEALEAVMLEMMGV